MRPLKCFHRAVFSALVLTGYQAQAVAQQTAAEALKQCDALMSHPQDPGRYAAGVPDDQLAPGAAIEACEPAAKLNPDLARAWFELGRAYWSGQRDKEAFSAFVEATKRNYAPAMKYLGDAYLTGRGLPASQRQDAQSALEWYKKSADGGFEDGKRAIAETEGQIKKVQTEAERNKFDPSIFQRPDFMTSVHTMSVIPDEDMNSFILYIHGFVHDLGGDQILFVDSHCKPLVSSQTAIAVRDTMLSMFAVQPRVDIVKGDYAGWLNSSQIKALTQGQRDAVALVNRYGCQSEVARKLMDHIDRMFDTSGRSGYSPPRPIVLRGWLLDQRCYQLQANWLHELHRKSGHSAFAVGRDSGCGYSASQPDYDTAKKVALKACANSGVDCKITHENGEILPWVRENR